MALVELQDVGKRFGDVRAVDGVSFSIGRGEVVGFLGPNGAGKTTTMRIITQSLEADEGRVEVDGRPLSADPLAARRKIGYLPETNPLYGEMLVGEFLDFVGRLRGLPPEGRRSRIDDVVVRTGIGEMFYRPIAQLSKGYRQRTGLAQAILAEPDLLILDEPTEGLDPNQRTEIRRLITDVGAERTVLLSTHVMQEVRATCDRLLIIHRGRLIADGSVDSLLADSGVRVTVELETEADAAREALRELPSVAEVRPAPARRRDSARPRFLLLGSPSSDPRPDVFDLARERGWRLWELKLESEDLEALFRDLTREEDR